MSELLSYLKAHIPDAAHRELYCLSFSAFLSGSISALEFEHYLRISLDSSIRKYYFLRELAMLFFAYLRIFVLILFSNRLLWYFFLVYIHNNFVKFLLYYLYGSDGRAASLDKILSTRVVSNYRPLLQASVEAASFPPAPSLDHCAPTLKLSEIRLLPEEIHRLEQLVCSS